MAELKIVATIVVLREYKTELERVFQKVVDATRKEEGNISYDLHQDIKNPCKYVILEVWKDQNATEFHNQTAHFKELLSATEGRVESLTVDVIEKVY